MTTNDIKSVQILMETNNGDILVGKTSNLTLIGMIAAYVKFVKVDRRNFTEIDIKELLKE